MNKIKLVTPIVALLIAVGGAFVTKANSSLLIDDVWRKIQSNPIQCEDVLDCEKGTGTACSVSGPFYDTQTLCESAGATVSAKLRP